MANDGIPIEKSIVEKAKELGASLAGIAKIEDLKASKSYEAYAKKPFYEEYDRESANYFEFEGVQWNEEHKSVLVWALVHPASEPPSCIGAYPGLVEHESPWFYPGQQSDEVAVEEAPGLVG
jgi:hypothetical protein